MINKSFEYSQLISNMSIIQLFSGAHCLKNLISIQQEFHKEFNITPLPTQVPSQTDNQSERLAEYIEKKQTDEISSIYPKTDNIPEKLDMSDEDEIQVKKVKKEV